MRPIAEAVGVLHANRLTHYDIKPENIIIVTESDGSLRPVLIDFGLSRHYDPEGNATSTIGMMGLSRGYAPIEQYHGLTEFTPEADVYSLGATLYFCLTGMTPEEAGKFQIERKLRELNLSLPSKMREGLIHSLEILQEHRTKDATIFVKETFDDSADLGEPSQDSEKAENVASSVLPDEKTVAIPSKAEVIDQKPENPINYSNSNNEKMESSKPKNSKKGKYAVIFSLVGLCIIGLIVWAIISSQDSAEYRETESVTTNIDGHDAVDLGLSVKWATCNVGAEKPSDYGDYYAWGETETKSKYTENNSLPEEISMSDIAGSQHDVAHTNWDRDMSDIAGSQYDAAHTNWDGSWRLPTLAEFKELMDFCKWQWTTVDGHNGYKVTGPNGNSIFLPAAGFRRGDNSEYLGSDGFYWSSMFDDLASAWELSFDDGNKNLIGSTDSGYGRSVRPVSK